MDAAVVRLGEEALGLFDEPVEEPDCILFFSVVIQSMPSGVIVINTFVYINY